MKPDAIKISEIPAIARDLARIGGSDNEKLPDNFGKIGA